MWIVKASGKVLKSRHKNRNFPNAWLGNFFPLNYRKNSSYFEQPFWMRHYYVSTLYPNKIILNLLIGIGVRQIFTPIPSSKTWFERKRSFNWSQKWNYTINHLFQPKKINLILPLSKGRLNFFCSTKKGSITLYFLHFLPFYNEYLDICKFAMKKQWSECKFQWIFKFYFILN